MYFRNNGLSAKVLPLDKKPTPFPRTSATGSSIAPSVSTLNKNCHEIINNDFGYYRSAATLNNTDASTGVNEMFVDDDEDETLENVDIDNDPHQRLIM